LASFHYWSHINCRYEWLRIIFIGFITRAIVDKTIISLDIIVVVVANNIIDVIVANNIVYVVVANNRAWNIGFILGRRIRGINCPVSITIVVFIIFVEF